MKLSDEDLADQSGAERDDGWLTRIHEQLVAPLWRGSVLEKQWQQEWRQILLATIDLGALHADWIEIAARAEGLSDFETETEEWLRFLVGHCADAEDERRLALSRAD